MTTLADIAAYTAAAVRGYLAAAGMYLEAVVQQNPGLSITQLLQRADVAASLDQAFLDARDYVTEAVQQAWDGGGADESAVYRHLVKDAEGSYSHTRQAHLRALLRVSHDPRETVEQFARELALHNSMTVQHAAAASALESRLTAAGSQPDAHLLAKRWVAHPENPACCFWCRRLHGVTIPLHADFTPHLGGPAALSGTGWLTQPPKPYRGHLQGPPLHPWCECDLKIVSLLSETEVGSAEARDGSALPFLASSHIRAMPEARYRALTEFLRAAAHELGMVLERLRSGQLGLDERQDPLLCSSCQGAKVDQTIRFRGDMPLAYAYAVILLTEHARTSGEEFDFGPLDQAAMRRSGLVVTGPDLTGVTEVLAGLPGLVRADA